MFSFFKKKISIDSISIPELGWPKEKERSAVRSVNPEETIAVSINFFDQAPDIPTIKVVNELRAFYRDLIISVNGGMIEVEVLKRQQFDIVRTIFKIPKPVSGMLYVGSLTIPFNTCSFVLKVQAVEFGPTGMREALIVNRLLQDGSFNDASWSADPYDNKITAGNLMNKSEDQKYDADFPDHPLTQVRNLLTRLAQGFTWDPALEKLPRFEL
jgi:hypothetical protein